MERWKAEIMNKMEVVETCLSGCMKILGGAQNDLPGVAAGCVEKEMESISEFVQSAATEGKIGLRKMINEGHRNGRC